jgi:hypothetical protein
MHCYHVAQKSIRTNVLADERVSSSSVLLIVVYSAIVHADIADGVIRVGDVSSPRVISKSLRRIYRLRKAILCKSKVNGGDGFS